MGSKTIQQQYVTAEFDHFFQECMKEWRIPGASLAIVSKNDIFAKGYGVIRPDGPPVTAETLFDSASMSKSFTASALALLVEDDEKYPDVKWDTPVSKLMREDFVLHDPQLTENVTIEDMLSHRTGIPEHEKACISQNAKQPDTPKSITRKLRHLPATKPLRTEYQYNNLMFTAASYLFETITGDIFYESLQARFWKPLGMNRTVFGRDSLDLSGSSDDVADGFYWNKDINSYVKTPFIHGIEGQGAGEIVSCASDWALWIRAMLQKDSVLSADSKAQLFKPRIIASKEPEDDSPAQGPIWYGMGWNVEYYRGEKVVSHSGGIPGFTSFMAFLPKRNFGYVMYGNSRGMSEMSEIIHYRLMDDCLGVPKEERADWVERKRIDEQKDEEERKKDGESVFPDRPSTPKPMSLSLSAYAGVYENPAYGQYVFEVVEGQLRANVPEPTFPFKLALEHVSGEYFIAVLEQIPNEYGELTRLESEFQVGTSGKVEKLGIDFLNEEDSEYVWFSRL